MHVITEQEIEAAAANMYGKNWNSPLADKRPGEQMKNVWRGYASLCLEGAQKYREEQAAIAKAQKEKANGTT